MKLTISTRLMLGFGLLIAMTLLMLILGVYAVATLDQRLDHIVHRNYKDTMNTVDIRETVNEVNRALYNLAITDDVEKRRSDVTRLENSEKAIKRTLDTLQDSLAAGDGALILKKILDAYTGYAAARSKVLALALENKDAEIEQAIRQDLRPAQNNLFNALDSVVNYHAERMEQSAAGAKRLATIAKTLLAGIGALALVSGVLFSVWISRSISRPTRAASRLSLAIAEGDLTQPVVATSADELGSLLTALEQMRRSLTHETRTIRRSAENVALASQEIAQGSVHLSDKAEQQAAQLEETASSMEQLTVTVKQNAENAARASQLAADASTVASRGGTAVRGVVGTMQGISESSRRISDIIGVIDSIAFQTNILALNAAVEAARAGEQGRGFAVVAAEVRSLAQRSAQAAKEITGLIQSSTVQVDAGAKLVESAGTTMDEIVAAVQSVTDIIAGISSASHEQLAGIEQVNQAVSQMSAATQQNAAVVVQSAASAESMASQARDLITAVSRFKLDSEVQPAVATAKQAPRAAFTTASAEPLHAQAPAQPSAQSPVQPLIPPRAALPRAPADGDGHWKEF